LAAEVAEEQTGEKQGAESSGQRSASNYIAFQSVFQIDARFEC